MASGKKQGYLEADGILLTLVLILAVFGLTMLFSTSEYNGRVRFGDSAYYFKKQLFAMFLGLLTMFLVAGMDYHFLVRLAPAAYGASLGLSAAVLVVGQEINGSRRWLNLGPLSFQPSELAKIAVIVCLSYMIVNMGRKIGTLKGFMMLAGSGGALAFITYVFTDNLSTAIIIFGITIGLIFIAHPKVRPFLIAAGILLVVAIVAISFLSATMETSSSFRLRRILVWLHPEDYASGDGYQTIQALYAIGSGGFLGRGLGNSIQKLGSVPEAQNDMIFSIVCEELGILGGMIVLLLFAYLLYRLFFIAQNAPDLFGSLIVSGIFIHIALQVIFNIAVVVNLMPNTGVTLPFISYGGTSILFLMAEMGLALSVARQIKFKEPERLL